MGLVYYYTDGTNATSISGSSPFAFGTQRSRQTTRTGMYDEIAAGLVAAGYTQHNLATRDDVWESAGESGLEKVYFRTKYLVPGSPTTQNTFNFYVGTKLDGSNNLQGQIGTTSGAPTTDGWITSTDTSLNLDYQLLATKDFVWINVRPVATAGTLTANDQLNCFMGILQRSGEVNQNVMALATNVSAGTYVSLDVTPVDPYTKGYRPGDFIQITSIATGEGAKAQTVRISSLGSNSIVVDSLALSYLAGARIAALPQPIVRFVSKNQDPDTTTQWTSPYEYSLPTALTNDITALTSGVILSKIRFAVGTTYADNADMGSGTTPNKRTKRFGCRSISLALSGGGLGKALVGRVPGIYAYPGSMSFFPHDTGTYNRVSPNQRFVGMRFSSSSTTPYMLGKVA